MTWETVNHITLYAATFLKTLFSEQVLSKFQQEVSSQQWAGFHGNLSIALLEAPVI